MVVGEESRMPPSSHLEDGSDKNIVWCSGWSIVLTVGGPGSNEILSDLERVILTQPSLPPRDVVKIKWRGEKPQTSWITMWEENTVDYTHDLLTHKFVKHKNKLNMTAGK